LAAALGSKSGVGCIGASINQRERVASLSGLTIIGNAYTFLWSANRFTPLPQFAYAGQSL
jgi:hypothetical protein